MQPSAPEWAVARFIVPQFNGQKAWVENAHSAPGLWFIQAEGSVGAIVVSHWAVSPMTLSWLADKEMTLPAKCKVYLMQAELNWKYLSLFFIR